MKEPLDILIDNLNDTFKAIEKVLALGLTAGLVLLVLAITDSGLSGEQRLILADINAPAFLVALAAMGTYFATGAMAAFYFSSRRKIVKRIARLHPELVDVVLTYPSIVSTVRAPQIVALALIGAIGMLALCLFYVPTNEMDKGLMSAAIIGSPYIVLVGMAFRTALEDRLGQNR